MGSVVFRSRGAILGHVEPFIPGSEPFENYLERLEAFFEVNETPESEKVASLIVLIGPVVYGVLKNLIAPDQPKNKTFKVLTETLRQHYAPVGLEVAERFKFHCRKQQVGELLRDFVVDLKKLAVSCNYGTFLNDALRDQLIYGLHDSVVKKRLLSEKKLNFEDAVKLASDLELVGEQARIMEGSQPDMIHAVKKPSVYNQKSVSKYQSVPSSEEKFSVMCKFCGKSHPLSRNKCPARDWQCYKCHQKGHVAKLCTFENCKHIMCKSQNCQMVFQVEPPLFMKVNLGMVVIDFEVDSGSASTLIPHSMYMRYFKHVPLNNSDVYRLAAANGEPLKVYGTMCIPVVISSKSFDDLLAVVVGNGLSHPLLGRDWLTSLNPDWRNSLLLNTRQNVNMLSPNPVSTFYSKSFLENIKVRFPNVFGSILDPIKDFEISIVMKEDAQPIFHKAYNVPYSLRNKVEEELSGLEKQNILSRINYSDWASPIVSVKRNNGGIRICADFKATVNRFVDIQHYPLPRVEDIFQSLVGCKLFCELDLTNAYLQLRVDESSKKYLTINTHVGLFRYNRLVFGLSTAPSAFQSVMDQILLGLPRVRAYLDNIIIGAETFDGLVDSLTKVMEKLNSHHVKLNVDKCKWFQSSIDLLGYRLDSDGLHPSPTKVEAIKLAPHPTNVSQLKSFLGLVNFYHNFIPMSADVLSPLYDLSKINSSWKWTPDCEQAFNKVKNILSENTLLVLYDPDKPLVLTTDSSCYGVGATLAHVVDGVETPIAFASTTLSPAEKQYCQLDRESLGIIFGVKRFHKYLAGRKFTLVTDHLPLQSIFNPRKGIPQVASARLQRWALILSSYLYEIKYKKGSLIANADALSRLPVMGSTEDAYCLSVNGSFEEQVLTFHRVAEQTVQDPVLSVLKDWVLKGCPNSSDVRSKIPNFFKLSSKLSVDRDCLLFGSRVIIPSKLRDEVLEILHKNHVGIVRTKMLARSYVWWPGMDQDIERKITCCETCQLTSSDSLPKVYVPMSQSSGPWQRIHVDFLDAFKSKIFLVVDSFSKWLECWCFESTNALCVINKLNECFSRYGFPHTVVSDNGPPFNSWELKKYFDSINVKHVFSPPYFPQSNGQAERSVQEIKKMLMRSVVSNSSSKSVSITRRLDDCLASYRFTPSTVTKKTPAELFLGFPVRHHLSMLNPSDKVDKNDGISASREFKINDKVLVKLPKAKLYKWVCARVMERIGSVLYLVKLPNDIIRKVHINQMKASQLPDSAHPLSREIEWYPESKDDDTPNVINPVDRPVVPPSSPRTRPLRNRRPPQKYSPSLYD